jgi:hypothetical protein
MGFTFPSILCSINCLTELFALGAGNLVSNHDELVITNIMHVPIVN